MDLSEQKSIADNEIGSMAKSHKKNFKLHKQLQ